MLKKKQPETRTTRSMLQKVATSVRLPIEHESQGIVRIGTSAGASLMAAQNLDALDASPACPDGHNEKSDSPTDLDTGRIGFFRNPGTLSFLKRSVFPEIVQLQSGNEPLRVWLPACATGEDAYSIAIAFNEFAEGRAEQVPIQIFAAYSDDNAIERARAGEYPRGIVDDISPKRLKRFFEKSEYGYDINRTIRNLCIFARHDLITDPPFSRMTWLFFAS